MKTDCPKCGSPSARYMKTRTDLFIVCLCGERKLIFTTLEEISIAHTDSAQKVKLPRRDTHLWSTLMVLSVLEPATSGELTERLRDLGKPFEISDVSSYLTILRSKGLVTQLLVRRGVAGGSTWQTTDRAQDLVWAMCGT